MSSIFTTNCDKRYSAYFFYFRMRITVLFIPFIITAIICRVHNKSLMMRHRVFFTNSFIIVSKLSGLDKKFLIRILSSVVRGITSIVIELFTSAIIFSSLLIKKHILAILLYQRLIYYSTFFLILYSITFFQTYMCILNKNFATLF